MRYFYTSVTRISDLENQEFQVKKLPRTQWQTGDYVVGKITTPTGKHPVIELPNGRMMEVMEGDLVVGAFGIRQATLEAVGSWQDIPEDLTMEALTEGGLFGKATSVSFIVDNLPTMVYEGHIISNDEKVCMKDFVENRPLIKYNCPTIMMIGTSMSSGKTTTARVIIHELKKLGLKIVGAKFAGAGQFHDILSMQDAGADAVFDFVNAGMPSSIADPEDYRECLKKLLTLIAEAKPDVVVAEAGASPFEPYNGSIVLEEIKEQICCTVMCASDPYAVLGVIESFNLTPDLISGIVTDTTAGVNLVEKMTKIKTLPLPDRNSIPELMTLLKQKLGI
jgi:Domain of unknown function (DUF1611_C) P-loop domain